MAEAALAELRDSILSGELPPGAPLRLEELAERLGMSISPVRQSMSSRVRATISPARMPSLASIIRMA